MVSDIGLAFRQLTKSRGFTVVAVLTLAPGIGVNTATFAIVNSIVLKPTPFADEGRLVMVFHTSQQSQWWPHTPGDFQEL